MPRTCTVCGHRERSEINQELVGAHRSVTAIADAFGLSESALRRHRSGHVPIELARIRKSSDLKEAETLTEQLRSLTNRLLPILEQAEKSGDTRTALAAVRELRNNVALGARTAEKSVLAIDLPVIRIYVARVVEILNEFVPTERLADAITKLANLAESIDLNSVDATSRPSDTGEPSS